MDETRYMERAFELARRAEGRVSPRPPVGSVIVSVEGDIVGEGWSLDGPGLHAEIHALQAAQDKASGATCYVTLEPCVKWCAPAIIEAGIERVVVATNDPNPRVNGGGVAMLENAGIVVDTGSMRDVALRLYAPFTKWITTGEPFVTLKLAATLDGKVAAPDGTSRWITGEAARAEVHELRRCVDAVVVGSGTVVADDPALTFRTPGLEGDQPLRVVLDSSGRTPRSAQVFDDAAPTLIITTEDKGVWSGAEVAVVSRAEGGVDVAEALRVLGERGLCHVLVEAGPTLAASFAEQGLVDRFLLYLAPKIIGGDAPGLFAHGVKTLTDAWQMQIERVRRVGDDICIEAVPA